MDYHRERLIRQIRTARQLAAECSQQTQQCMKLYDDQHAKYHPFKVGHKVWIYDPAVKLGLSKKLCSLWHAPFHLVEQVTSVSFKVCNLQDKLQKGSVHVNRMKQYFSYDDPPIDPPPQSNSPGNSPDPTPTPKHFFPELLATENSDLVQPDDVATDHVDNLEEIPPFPDLTEIQLQQQKIKDIDDRDNQLDIITTTLPNCVTTNNANNQLAINTLPNCATNHEKQNATHPIEKETLASNHTLSGRVINRGKQSVARSTETNNFNNNLDQQKTRNNDIPTDNHPILANDSNIYLVEQVKKHRHRNGKLEFLIKWLGFSNRHNTWEPENYLPPALVQEYFQESKLEQPTPTNAVFLTKILTKEPVITWRCYILRPLVLICLLALWSLFVKAQPTSIPALHLGPLYNCSQPRHLGISVFSSLSNCSHNML